MGSESEISVLLKRAISRLKFLLIILSLYLSVPFAWAQSLPDQEVDRLRPRRLPCNRRWMRLGILAVLLISTISLSMAACPRPMPDLYYANCVEVLEVSAPGLLANDVKDPGKTLSVVDPELIAIDPKYGTLTVQANGSFTYAALPTVASGTYVVFYYNVTDGSCVSAQTYAKIQVSCKCHAVAPSPPCYCLGVTIDEIRADLISKGAGCPGCYDVAGTIDLSRVDVTKAGTYPYSVICGIGKTSGTVCISSHSCISGYKLNKSDGSGLGGWMIEVFNSTGRKVGEDSTDSTGYWQVCGLVPGNYRVNEILQPGWISISKPAEVILGCDDIINQNFTNLKDSASIHIVKRTNGVDSNTAPGQNIPVGSPVTWSYEVKNTGNVVLTNVVVTDDKLGQIGTIASLAVGETKTLTTPPGPTAVAGQYSNNATAIGKTPDELGSLRHRSRLLLRPGPRHLAHQEDQWRRFQYRPRPKHSGGQSGHLEL